MNGGLIRRGLVFAVILAVWGGQQIQGATTAGASNIQVSTVGTFTTYQVMHDLFSTSLNDLLPGGTTSHQKIAATPVLCATGVTYGATEKVPNGPTAGKVALYDEESAAPTMRGCIDFARSTTAPSSGTVSTHFDYYAFALDAVAPLVGSNAGGSSRSPVTLSLTDMKKIYLCRPGYTNWKTVTGPTAKPATGNNTQGGVTAPIVRFWPQAGSDTGSLYAAMLGFTPDATTYHTAAGSTCGSAAHPTADRPTSTFTTGLGAGKVNEENSEQGIIYASTTATLGDPAIADAIFIYSAGKFAEQWNTKTNYVSTKVNSISGTAIGNFKANTLLLAKMTNRATAATTKVFDTYGAPSGTFSPTSNRGSYTVNAAVVKESNEWYSHIASNSDGVTASTSPVPGVRYVYNVADSSLPTYGEAKMMIGFDNQASGAKSSLCNGDDAATIIAAGLVPLNSGTTAPATGDKARASCREFPGRSYPGLGGSKSWTYNTWVNPTTPPLPPAPQVTGSAPASPPAVVCGVGGMLDGPPTAPTRSVTLLPSENIADVVSEYGANTTFWLSPGTYTLGTGEFDQIDPATGDTFIGAPAAVVNGQDDNESAFAGSAPNVTIEYLSIENFVAPQNEGVVNHDSASGWIIEHDTVQDNPYGAGVMLGSDDVLMDDCLTENGQYGFQSYSTSTGPNRVTVTGNEISYNDTANYTETTTSCGCTGGAKFWDTTLATVTDNYVHNNESVGLWMDTDNDGFNVSKNYFSTNYGEGIIYEISYNAQIEDNTFIHNAVGAGPQNPAFPTGALYISESGSDSRVPGWYHTSFTIKGNVFDDNWSGVILWENSNRYCGSSANTSTGACTLVDPSVYTVSLCANNVPTSTPARVPDYYDNCRWKTQNVAVTENTFDLTPTAVGATCTAANGCGFNGLFSEYGTYPPYTEWVVPNHISNDQNDHFTDNSYTGPWNFMGFAQDEVVTWAQWTAGFNDSNGSGDHFGAQDAGSSYTQ